MVDSAKMVESHRRDNSEEELWQKSFAMIANPATLDQGFELLLKVADPVITRCLRRVEGPRHDHEDIVSTVIQRLWESRENRIYPSLAELKAYVLRSANNERKDRRKSAHERRNLDGEQLESSIDPASDDLLRRIEEHDAFRQTLEIADNLWLGKEPANYELKMMAATMIFKDRKRLSVALQSLKLLGADPRDLNPITIINWITEPTILKRLGYSIIYHRPEEIFDAITKGEQIDSRDEFVLLWQRFVHFVPKARLINSYPKAQQASINAILDKFESRLPFASSMESMLKSLYSIDTKAEALSKADLWKRVIFQYYIYKLPREDMKQWFEKSANLARFELTENRIHRWIAIGDLKTQLRQAIESGEYN